MTKSKQRVAVLGNWCPDKCYPGVLTQWGFECSIYQDFYLNLDTLLEEKNVEYAIILLRCGRSGINLIRIPDIKRLWPKAIVIAFFESNDYLDTALGTYQANHYWRSARNNRAELARIINL